MHKRTLLPLAIAAVFALTGCTGSATEAGASSAAVNASTGAEAKPVADEQLDSQMLVDIARELAGDNSGAQIIDEDAMRAQVPMAEQSMKSMKIEPAKCAALVSADLSAEFDKMNMVSVTLPGKTAFEGVQVSIASYTEPEDAAANISQNQKMLKDCSSLSMTMQGQTVEMKVTGIDAKTKASLTEANRSVVSVPGGEIQTVAVSANEGRNLISVSVMGGSDEAAGVDRAQDLVNSVLVMIEERAS